MACRCSRRELLVLALSCTLEQRNGMRLTSDTKMSANNICSALAHFQPCTEMA